MQTLGLSESTPRTESRLKSLFWPSIKTGADVDYLAVQGFWVCTIVGALSLFFLTVSGHYIMGPLVFLLFHLGGVGVREHNAFAAAITLAYYVADFLLAIVFLFLNTPGIAVVRIIIIALLFSNLRATWIAGNWKPESEEAALPPRMGDTLADKFSDKWPAWVWPKIKIVYFLYSAGFVFLSMVGTAYSIIMRSLR